MPMSHKTLGTNEIKILTPKWTKQCSLEEMIQLMVNKLKKPETYLFFFPFNIGISYNMISPSTLFYQGMMCHLRQSSLTTIKVNCLTWYIQRERNSRSFEGRERSIIEIKSFFFFTLLEWSLVLPSFSCMSLPVLLDHCNLVS